MGETKRQYFTRRQRVSATRRDLKPKMYIHTSVIQVTHKRSSTVHAHNFILFCFIPLFSFPFFLTLIYLCCVFFLHTHTTRNHEVIVSNQEKQHLELQAVNHNDGLGHHKDASNVVPSTMSRTQHLLRRSSVLKESRGLGPGSSRTRSKYSPAFDRPSAFRRARSKGLLCHELLT